MKTLKDFANDMAVHMINEAEWDYFSSENNEEKLRNLLNNTANNYVSSLTFDEALELKVDSFVLSCEVVKGGFEYMDLGMALYQIIFNWLLEVLPIIVNCIVAYYEFGDDTDDNCECFYQVRRSIDRLY